MAQATPFLLVLFLTLGAHSVSAEKCSLAGHWVNDLGSNMTIDIMKANGNFTGIYYTAVSVHSIEKSPLLGSQHLPDQPNHQPAFGFTVHWTFSDSMAVFMGQCFVDDGKEVLKTMWLLRSHVDVLRDDWKATRVGYNEFTCLE
ncbi:avidin-related protein 4/5-like [Chamaea fasciata]|uniref:avidin-related protein 4/5-like n=1 Tax=Chamaea fasciata TaxID=190680 RepID=UPI00336AB4A6